MPSVRVRGVFGGEPVPGVPAVIEKVVVYISTPDLGHGLIFSEGRLPRVVDVRHLNHGPPAVEVYFEIPTEEEVHWYMDHEGFTEVLDG